MLKFMLHISRDEQKARFEERIADETKNWKFRVGDLDDRKRWDDFTKAYRGILENTSTDWAPWYVVPADDKDVRNYLIARCIADTLESLDLKYPPPIPSWPTWRFNEDARVPIRARCSRCVACTPHAPRAACSDGAAHVRARRRRR